MKRSLTILFTLFALTLSALGITTPAVAADKTTDLPSVAEFLNPDGTLNLSAGYSGNLDISHYAVTLNPARGPLFSPPQMLTPNAWNALGTGLNSYVLAIAISGTDVYAGGGFTDAGGDPNADYIAKWNGSTWSALGGTPLNSAVYAIAISGTNVYAGGGFGDAGGDANADYIAKWNGSAWSALGTGLNFYVYAIAISGTDVYVGGGFSNAGGIVNATGIAKWNGSVWSALGPGVSSGFVRAIAISGMDVYAGGYFTNTGGVAEADYIAKWNGSAWSALGGTPLTGGVVAIAIGGTDVYAGGEFTDAGGDVNADKIAKWNGSAWSALGGTPLNSYIQGLAISGTDVYAGGGFTDAGGDVNADYIAVFVADITAPAVTSFVARSPSSSLVIPIPGFTAADNIGVTGYLVTESSTAPSASDSGWVGTAPTTYTVASDGNYTLYPWAKDAAGNVSSFLGSLAYVTVDTTPPTVASIVRANNNPTNLASVDFTVTFSESVNDGVDKSDFALTTTGVSGAFIMDASGSDATYTVSVNTGTGDGTIRLDVVDDDSILDAASNPLNGGFTGGETYNVDKNDAPTANSLDNSSVAGNLPVGTVVGTFSSIDADSGDTFTYSLVSGTGDADNASFSIAGDQLQTAAVFDSTVKSSYIMRVRTTDNGAGNLFFEQAFTITVTANNITPGLLAPVNLELLIINRPTFDWTDVLGSTSYRIQIYKTAAFAKSGKVVDATTTSSTFTPLSDLPTGISLYWRVSRNTAAGAGPWSEIRSFKIALPPDVPGPLSPKSNSKNISLTPSLDWSDSTPFAGTTLLKYELQLSTDSTFTSPVNFETTSSNYTLSTSLNQNTKYYWRVRACNNLGQCSAWSTARNFTTIP